MTPRHRSTPLVPEETTARWKRLSAPRHAWLLIAFAFTVMADPISSVAYAVEAALRALQGTSVCSCLAWRL